MHPWKEAWARARAAGPEAVEALKAEVAAARAKKVERNLAEARDYASSMSRCTRCGAELPSRRRRLCPPCRAGARRG